MALIPIKEYGERHGVSHGIMRQRCDRGSFKSARKIGNSWFIDENEEFVDHRKTPKSGGGGPARRLVDSRFPPNWADEFGGYWPEIKVCSHCVDAIRPRWLDLQLEGWDLMDVPYSERREQIKTVLNKIYCERCAARILDGFDKKYE